MKLLELFALGASLALSLQARAGSLPFGSDGEVFDTPSVFTKALAEVELMPEPELRSFTSYLTKCRGSFGFKNDLIERACKDARLEFLIIYNQDRAVDRSIQGLMSISTLLKGAFASQDRKTVDRYLAPVMNKEGEMCRAANRRFRTLAKVPAKPSQPGVATAICYTE